MQEPCSHLHVHIWYSCATPLCSAENVYCVTPTITQCSSCRQTNVVHSVCSKSSNVFSSLCFFLPSDHVPHAHITATNVARLTMHRESSTINIAKIVCSGLVSLSFTSMKEFIFLSFYILHQESWHMPYFCTLHNTLS